MSSDLATTFSDVTGYIQAALQGITGLSADLVKYGTHREPPGPKSITFRLVIGQPDEQGGTLRSERIAATYEARLYAPATEDAPLARDSAALALWQQVRTALYADKTFGAKVRNVTVGTLTPPGAAGDIGEPPNAAVTTITVIWNASI